MHNLWKPFFRRETPAPNMVQTFETELANRNRERRENNKRQRQNTPRYGQNKKAKNQNYARSNFGP